MWSVELGAAELLPSIWGNKPYRLGLLMDVSSAAVPPGLCLLPEAWNSANLNGLASRIQDWLHVHLPEQVIVRGATTSEDHEGTSHAGAGRTVADVNPVPTDIIAILETFGPETTASVIVQTQVNGTWSGVAIGNHDTFLVEASRRAQAVTAGDQVEVWVRRSPSGIDVGGPGAGSFPGWHIAHAIEHLFGSLQVWFSGDLDVEWVWRDGAIYLLQVRPSTSRTP